MQFHPGCLSNQKKKKKKKGKLATTDLNILDFTDQC